MTLDDLDKLAAEKVMGWSWMPVKDAYEAMESEYRRIDNWQPTRNIAHAWECLEKIGLGADILCCFKNAKTASGKSFLCRLLRTEETIDETAQSAPEAIVRACLKAKGVEIS